MTNKDASKQPTVEPNDAIQQSATAPLVFISHDGRDADFADAFSNTEGDRVRSCNNTFYLIGYSHGETFTN